MTVDVSTIVHAALGIKFDVKTKAELLKQFSQVETYLEILDAARKQLREKMMSVAEKHGEVDPKGSYFIHLPDGTGWKREIRRPAPMVNRVKALELMKAKGLNHRITITKDIDEEKKDRVISILENTAPEFVITKEIIEDSDIETAFNNDEITDTELKSVVEQGEPTYALKMVIPK